MTPEQLQAEQFSGYPPEARRLATDHLALLRQLPLSYLPLLLREVIVYDWKFPAERREIDNQFSYLGGLSPAALTGCMSSFAKLRLSPALEQTDWVNAPGLYSEQLSAHLWATHQIDEFRTSATLYIEKVHEANPVPAPPVPRLGMVAIGKDVPANTYPLFRKLRPFGTHFTNVQGEKGLETMLAAASARADSHPQPFAHWYVDGGRAERPGSPHVTLVSYSSVHPLRAALLTAIDDSMRSGAGPEALRTTLAQMRPNQLGLSDAGAEGVLNRFQISVLTEGSGTQIYSTTFVQWSARELLRRAEPLTLVARFAPRQRERSMEQLLTRPDERAEPDPRGSLIDADMGAYYTWINQQRLPGAANSSFLVWYENHNEALAIAPGVAKASTSDESLTLADLLRRIG